MADDVARATVSSPLQFQRTCLARTLQGISDRTGRTPADGPPIRRTESAPRRPRRTCRRLDLVESRLAGRCKAACDARPVARRLPAQLGPPRKRATNRGWTPSVAVKQPPKKPQRILASPLGFILFWRQRISRAPTIAADLLRQFERRAIGAVREGLERIEFNVKGHQPD
jgi:hypothetical protein